MHATDEATYRAIEHLEDQGKEPTDENIQDVLEAWAEYQMEMDRGN